MRAYLYISYNCNCNCFFCASDETNRLSENNEVSLEDAKRFILSSPNKQKLDISGGEPTIHKDFLEIVRFAKQNFEYVTVMTNGIRFADIDFLKAAIDAGIDRISIPFYSAYKNEHNYMVGNPTAFTKLIQGLSNINSLLPEIKVDVQIKLLLAKFTYKQIPNSIEYIAENFPNIRLVSLYGFHISNKALHNKDLCIINYNESRLFNDISIKKLIDNNYDFHVCEIPLCAFSLKTIEHLLMYKRIAYIDETFLKRPNITPQHVSSNTLYPEECQVCKLSHLCPKIYGKNASLFNHGIKPIV